MSEGSDEEKLKKCKESGIATIHIPYWWDQTPNSLLATLNHYRPDLIGTHNSSVEMG